MDKSVIANEASSETEIYQRQLNFVESMVEFHPESLGLFTAEELAMFKRFFLPDWDSAGHYRDYYQRMRDEYPGIEIEARELLSKYLDHHQVVGRRDLLGL